MNEMGNIRFGTLTILRLQYLGHHIHRFTHSWMTKHVYTKYWYWRLRNECWPFMRRNTAKTMRTFSSRPTFLLLTFFRPDDTLDHFKSTLDSVQAQHYPNWEWVIFCGSGQAERIRQLIVNVDRNQHIRLILTDGPEAVALPDLLRDVSAEFIGFLGANDTLAPFALFEICRAHNRDAAIDLFFSDEDHLDEKNRRTDPWFKQEYSLYNLRSVASLNAFLVLRKALLQEILSNEIDQPNWASGLNRDPNLFDLSLRAGERRPRIGRIPTILYHNRRQRKLSQNEDRLFELDEAETQALRSHLKRQKIAAEVLPNNYPDTFRVRYAVQGQPLVSIIIPTRDQVASLQRCISSIRDKTTYPNYEILIADDNGQLPETLAWFAALEADPDFRGEVVRWDKPSNAAWIYNVTARHARGEFLLFLSDTMEVISPDWIEELLGLAQQPDVGAVGGKLFTPAGKLQHAGTAWEHLRQLIFFNPAEGMDGTHPGYYGFTRKIHSVRVLSGGCLMAERARFEQVGGFDGNFSFAFYDADLCLKFGGQGLLNLYTPYAQLIQYGPLPCRKKENEAQNKEAARNYRALLKKWQPVFAQRDTSLSEHLRFRQFFEEAI